MTAFCGVLGFARVFFPGRAMVGRTEETPTVLHTSMVWVSAKKYPMSASSSTLTH